MATGASAGTPTCPWSSFYRPSDLEHNLNFFEPLSYLAPGGKVDSEEPATPDPGIFTWSKTTRTQTLLPTKADCATHLQLLQCFLRLRFQVISSTKLDDTLGIRPRYRKVHVPQDYNPRSGPRSGTTTDAVGSVPVRVKDPTYPLRREDKWPFFVGLAASRFLAWVDVIENRLSNNGMNNYDGKQLTDSENTLFLPPIDILMVWHALLLDPSRMRNLIVNGKKVFSMPQVRFPWQEIHEAITVTSGHTYNFSPSASDSDSFEKYFNKLGAQDLLTYLESQSTVKPPTALSKALKYFGLPPNRINKDTLRSRGVSSSDFPQIDDKSLYTRDRAFLLSTREAFRMSATIKDLVSAVQRQSLLIDRMDFTNWLASPSLEGTLSRGIERYARFMKLFKFMQGLGPEQRQVMLVPTLDIDLVWCTSRCTSPDDYKRTCQSLAGQYIDLNVHPRGENGWLGPREDKPQMNSCYEYTSDLYRVRYGSEYGICLCWECEALRSAMEEEDGQDLEEERDIKDIAHEVLVKVTRYRVAEKKRRAAAVKEWSDIYWPGGST